MICMSEEGAAASFAPCVCDAAGEGDGVDTGASIESGERGALVEGEGECEGRGEESVSHALDRLSTDSADCTSMYEY